MIRRILVLTSTALVACLLTLSCKESGSTATDGGDGGRAPKLICKMNNQCWICPDEAAMKKCIINPGTSGCKLSSDGDCR